MKKMIIGLMVGSLLTTTVSGALAAPQGHPRRGPEPKRPGYEQKRTPPAPPNAHRDREAQKLKADANYILRRTAQVLSEAQQIGRRSRHYSGIGLAVAHQQKARELYLKGSYREAIAFSLRSRDLAFQIIRTNKGKIRPDYQRDQREAGYYNHSEGVKLDARLEKSKISRDRDALHLKIEINL